MTFDEWMAGVAPAYKPTDDTVTLRILRQCWAESQAAERAALLDLAAATGWGMANSDTFFEAVRDICQMRERA